VRGIPLEDSPELSGPVLVPDEMSLNCRTDGPGRS